MTQHTPGPWAWFGSPRHGSSFYLATTHSGRRYVMGFRRMGMQQAQPIFQVNGRMVNAQDLCIFEVCPEATDPDDPRVYRHDIIGFRHPDARLIAAAPELLAALKQLCAGAIAAGIPADQHVGLAAIAKAESL